MAAVKKKTRAIKKNRTFSDQVLLELIVKTAEDKKGETIQVLNVSKIFPLADFFVLVTGKNLPHLKVLAKEIEEKVFEVHQIPCRLEGMVASRWLILDAGNIIVHIMGEQERKHYSLEKIWQGALAVTYY